MCTVRRHNGADRELTAPQAKWQAAGCHTQPACQWLRTYQACGHHPCDHALPGCHCSQALKLWGMCTTVQSQVPCPVGSAPSAVALGPEWRLHCSFECRLSCTDSKATATLCMGAGAQSSLVWKCWPPAWLAPGCWSHLPPRLHELHVARVLYAQHPVKSRLLQQLRLALADATGVGPDQLAGRLQENSLHSQLQAEMILH